MLSLSEQIDKLKRNSHVHNLHTRCTYINTH